MLLSQTDWILIQVILVSDGGGGEGEELGSRLQDQEVCVTWHEPLPTSLSSKVIFFFYYSISKFFWGGGRVHRVKFLKLFNLDAFLHLKKIVLMLQGRTSMVLESCVTILFVLISIF